MAPGSRGALGARGAPEGPSLAGAGGQDGSGSGPASARRRPTPRQVLGRAGEAAAADWYTANGYEILARNWRTPEGELDLVVTRRRQIVFCEVKCRTSGAFGSPAEAVTPRKQARIRHLAAQWLATQQPATAPTRGHAVRFDVASVLAGTVEILEGVF